MKKTLEKIGEVTLLQLDQLGTVFVLAIKTVAYIFKRPFSVKNLMEQMVRIGFNSIPVALITALSTGMVLALQTGFTLKARLQGSEQYLGAIVGLSFVRELGPTLTALMVTGRIGSAIAAELGTMKVTEQIDALVTLSANPIQYLSVPRFLAAILMFPALTITADIVGIIGGGIAATSLFNLSVQNYLQQTLLYIKLADISGGLVKSVVFGGMMAIISCFQGFNTRGGAEGVGISTTRAVVITSVSIIISDYLMSAIITKLFRF